VLPIAADMEESSHFVTLSLDAQKQKAVGPLKLSEIRERNVHTTLNDKLRCRITISRKL